MCDYSLMALKSRPAKVGDKLIVTNFGTATYGFRGVEDTKDPEAMTAVCVLPGSEIAFDRDVVNRFNSKIHEHRVGIFRQIDKHNTHVHHDALEFPDGELITLTSIEENTCATVLQLPAAPKTEQEAKEQTRVAVVA